MAEGILRSSGAVRVTPRVTVTPEEAPLPLRDPFQVFLALRERFGADDVYLLESLSGPQRDAQVSLIGFNPLLEVRVKGTEVEIGGVPGLAEEVLGQAVAAGALAGAAGRYTLPSRHDLWNLLRAVQGSFAVPTDEPGTRFTFGFFGYLGYDTAWTIEELPSLIQPDLEIPDVVLVVYQGFVEFDVIEQTGRVVVNSAPDFWPSIPTAEVAAIVERAPARPEGREELPRIPAPGPIRDSITEEAYLASVRRALEYIAIGDIYQVQLGHQIEVRTEADPLDVYRRLRLRNPSPYMYIAPLHDITLVGASPELFVRLQGGEITIRPIAGTVRRGADPESDRRLVEQLKADEKELAEHVMLVDLARNDIGRVCRQGTLEVTELLVVEQYSHVNHLVSNVAGLQAEGADAYDVIAASFPAGTMTGAPKIRAMEIIEELETSRRGAYAGAVGLIDFTGYVNTALCIRSTIHTQGRYLLRASAGVVADSVPEKEWSETLHKMAITYWSVTDEEIANARFAH